MIVSRVVHMGASVIDPALPDASCLPRTSLIVCSEWKMSEGFRVCISGGRAEGESDKIQ